MDATTENEAVATQCYPLAATAPPRPVHGPRPSDQPSDACPVARNADRNRLQLPSVAADPDSIVMQSSRDIFHWGSDEEEDSEGEDHEEEVVEGGCSGDAADADPELPPSDSLPAPTPTASTDPPNTDPWDSPEYLAGPELADAFTLAVATLGLLVSCKTRVDTRYPGVLGKSGVLARWILANYRYPTIAVPHPQD